MANSNSAVPYSSVTHNIAVACQLFCLYSLSTSPQHLGPVYTGTLPHAPLVCVQLDKFTLQLEQLTLSYRMSLLLAALTQDILVLAKRQTTLTSSNPLFL